MVAMLLVVSGHVNGVVPAVLDEIDALAAGTVFMTMLVPVLDVVWLNMQVDRLLHHNYLLDNYGFSVDEPWWRVVTNVYLPIESGLSQ